MIESPSALTNRIMSGLLGDESKPATALVAASIREMLLRVDAVCAITGLSVPTLYRLISKGDFPPPVQLTAHARAWKLSELMNWIESRKRVPLGVSPE